MNDELVMMVKFVPLVILVFKEYVLVKHSLMVLSAEQMEKPVMHELVSVHSRTHAHETFLLF